MIECRGRLFSSLLLITAGALGGAGAAACSSGQQASGAQGQQTPGGPGSRVLPVAAAAAQRRDMARAVTVVGPVEPIRTIGVNSLMAGTVLALRVQEGDRVRPGQLLAELDARETRAQLERARAVLASATATFERNQQLHATRIITDAEFEQSRAAYEVAKSEAELWSTRAAFSRITAPSAGIVTAKHVEAGSAVSPNQRVFDLADVSELVVRVRLSELDVVHLRPGAAVTVTLDAYPDVRLPGVIRRVFPSADPESRLVPVEVVLGEAPDGVRVRPGYLARATFALDRRAGALAVPAPAVGVAEDGAFVYVVQSDSVIRRPVAVGLSADGWVEISRGLSEGEMVVTSGHTSLRPGARVRVSGARGDTGE
ncbi:MAG: efflux RND transporter periplasmic adaptor subunit [Gemmatimonadales bacterium]